jgi:uncharacterized protein YgfB (UPF0149 family)
MSLRSRTNVLSEKTGLKHSWCFRFLTDLGLFSKAMASAFNKTIPEMDETLARQVLAQASWDDTQEEEDETPPPPKPTPPRSFDPEAILGLSPV